MLSRIALVLCTALLALGSGTPAAQADPRFETAPDPIGPFGVLGTREVLGRGWLATNDFFGDRKDRWRTGSLTSSRVWGHGWTGQVPYEFGSLIELRLQGQIIAPDRLTAFVPGDRPWAGSLSAGLHTHFMLGRTEMSVGGDLVLIGPQTQLDSFQEEFHQLINVRSPSDSVFNRQIGNTIRPTFVAEAGRNFMLGTQSHIRPFAEARAGDETLLRVGADLTFGVRGLGELLVRENVTGQRYQAIKADNAGVSMVLGADIAHVFDSVYLPENRGFQLIDQRERLRAGLQWRKGGTGVFYGLTWLGEEFVGQPDSQIVGSVKLDIRF